MINPFSTMWLQLLAFLILRLMVGVSLMSLGLRHIQKQTELDAQLIQLSRAFPKGIALFFGCAELIIGGMLFAGFSTQYACLAGITLFIPAALIRKHLTTTSLPDRHYYLLLIGALLSLFITGAGALAFDLPV